MTIYITSSSRETIRIHGVIVILQEAQIVTKFASVRQFLRRYPEKGLAADGVIVPGVDGETDCLQVAEQFVRRGMAVEEIGVDKPLVAAEPVAAGVFLGRVGEQDPAFGLEPPVDVAEQIEVIYNGNVENAVRGRDGVELVGSESNFPHVAFGGVHFRCIFRGQFEHPPGKVDAGHPPSLADEITGDRFARAAAQIEQFSFVLTQGIVKHA